VKDAHLKFEPVCYFAFKYSQQLSLYSVLNNDKQIIKIFEDKIDKNTIDCEVTHIDGRPSIEVVEEFADTLLISRDSGVRFNTALSGVIFTENGDLVEFPGSIPYTTFTTRYQLPKNSSVEYSLKCVNDTLKKFTREWKIRPEYSNTFNTSKDYWNTFCLKNDSITLSGSDAETVPLKTYNMSESKMVYNTLVSKFFILSDNKTGVIVISSVLPSDFDFVNEMFEIQNGFNSLENRGVKKVSTISFSYLVIYFLDYY
jgi:hypothetical protein